uniref:Meg domain-containing protein n=1 Tax=Oryza meridionalis TaxID=40149 RepID=A0A0E0C2Z3_9ORYZ
MQKGYIIHGLTLIKKMVEQPKHSTKVLMVVFLVLLGCFAIPGHEGKSIDYTENETRKGGNYGVMDSGEIACIKQFAGHYAGYFCCFNTRSRHNGECYSTVSDCLPNCFQIL